MSDIIATLFRDGRDFSFDDGEVLFHRGDRVRSMYLVTAGRIDLVRHTESGARMILQRVAPGQALAEASAYSRTYHCDGTASDASSVCAIPVDVFRERLMRDPDASAAWSAQLSHDLQSARLHAEIRTLRTVAERLDAWLSGERTLPPRGQWQDLAELLGVSREALYRELAKRR